MRAAIFASLVPAPDSDKARERLEDLIATIVDWDQVKDGNQISESANQQISKSANHALQAWYSSDLLRKPGAVHI